MDKNQVELLKSILNATEKHPNAKVSKLIKGFELEKTPQNIALLLIELAEHPEFSSDTTISLKYYLDCFRRLEQEASFAEAGVVLYNSSKIYAKRVDHVHQEIERLILSLSNVENIEKNTDDENGVENAIVKEKRGRKRPLEPINGPFEANMSAKRFKTLPGNKRFDNVASPNKRNNSALKKPGPLNDADKSIKNYIPQATWQHSVIEDFDYEDEIDSKKNYKLFTYHLEHRYNTLIPDINFKMYFKIKDFIDGADGDDCGVPESWPPLSDAYIEQYLNLEDAILLKEGHLGRTQEKVDASRLKEISESCFNNSSKDSGIESAVNFSCSTSNIYQETTQLTSNITSTSSSSELKEPMEKTHCESNLTQLTSQNSGSISVIGSEASMHFDSNLSHLDSQNSTSDSGISSEASMQCETNEISKISVLEDNSISVSINAEKTQTKNESEKGTDKDSTLLDPTKNNEEDLSTLKLILPHISDKAILMSDLDEKNRQMLSPSVVAQDVFRCIKDKSNIIITVDETVEHLFKVKEPSIKEILSLPLFERPDFLLRLNIFKIPLKHFHKRRKFKLTAEYDLLKKDRLKKYIKRSSLLVKQHLIPRKWVRISEDVVGVHISPPSSPSYEPDWLGFPEESSLDKNRTLSRDSGISLHQTDDFGDISDLMSSTLKTTNDEENISIQDKSSDSFKECDNIVNYTITNEKNEKSSSNDSSEEDTGTNEKNEKIENISSNDNTSNGNKQNTNFNVDNQSKEMEKVDEEARIRTKVHEWHNHLRPILACSRERHHFDVFALGTEIMTQFDRNDVAVEQVSFNNVMEEKDESLISRYFLSMLLLANQGNIRIDVQNKSTSDPSELHDIRLKLISRKRNIVSFEDNIGLITQSTTPNATPSTLAIINPKEVGSASANTVAIVRTLKSVPEVPKMDDRDSGVAMSEELTA